MRKFATAAALVVAVAGIAAGQSAATPLVGAAPVNYTATATEKSAIITTDAGSLTIEDGVFKVQAPDGTVVAGAELSFRIDDFVFPISAQIEDRTAILTPLFDREHAVYRPVALPFEDQAPWRSAYEREQAAWGRMTSTVLMGSAVGSLVGSIGGAAVGCVLGGIAGATIASATVVGLFGAFLPAAAVGCIGGVIAVGALGALAGQLLVTAPVAILAAIQYFTTINEPMPTHPIP